MDFEGFAAHQCFDAHRRFALLPESPIATLFTAEIPVIPRTRAAPTTPQPSNGLRGGHLLQKTIGVAAPDIVG
jgi:hypothetical protein